MSRATKRKHVLLEVLQDDYSPPADNQRIVCIQASRGNNLHEVTTEDGVVFLASMPTKFRKNVWVKRGDFVLVEPIEEGDKVKGEIVRILTREHIKYYKRDGLWPKGFDTDKSGREEEDADGDVLVNPNKRVLSESESDSSGSDHSDDSPE